MSVKPKTSRTTPEQDLLRMMRASDNTWIRETAERVSRVPGWTVRELQAALRERLDQTKTSK